MSFMIRYILLVWFCKEREMKKKYENGEARKKRKKENLVHPEIQTMFSGFPIDGHLLLQFPRIMFVFNIIPDTSLKMQQVMVYSPLSLSLCSYPILNMMQLLLFSSCFLSLLLSLTQLKIPFSFLLQHLSDFCFIPFFPTNLEFLIQICGL